jgi:hypothetical protein
MQAKEALRIDIRNITITIHGIFEEAITLRHEVAHIARSLPGPVYCDSQEARLRAGRLSIRIGSNWERGQRKLQDELVIGHQCTQDVAYTTLWLSDKIGGCDMTQCLRGLKDDNCVGVDGGIRRGCYWLVYDLSSVSIYCPSSPRLTDHAKTHNVFIYVSRSYGAGC